MRSMHFFALIDDTRHEVRLADTDSGPDDPPALVDGVPVPIELAPAADSPVRSVRIGGRSLRVLPRRDAEGRWWLDAEGHRFSALVLDRGQDAVRQARTATGAGSGPITLRAPMPGLVVRVEVAPGDQVQAGQGIVIVEAMKMENELKAAAPGVVRAVHVAAGATVEKDMVLVEFDAPGGGAASPEAGDEG
jgi:acetyl/propionyl-CoA carboxylase alpha subunit